MACSSRLTPLFQSLAGTAGLVAVIGKSYREAPLTVVGVLRILLPRLLAHLLDKPGQLSHTSTLDLVAETSQSESLFSMGLQQLALKG